MRWVRVVVLLGLLIAPTTARVAGQEAPPSSGATSAAPAAPANAAPVAPVAPSNAAPTAQEPAADGPAGGPAVTLPAPTTAAASPSEDAARPSDDASWVATHQSTDLWSDSDAGRSFGTVRPFTYFQLTGQ